MKLEGHVLSRSDYRRDLRSKRRLGRGHGASMRKPPLDNRLTEAAGAFCLRDTCDQRFVLVLASLVAAVSSSIPPSVTRLVSLSAASTGSGRSGSLPPACGWAELEVPESLRVNHVETGARFCSPCRLVKVYVREALVWRDIRGGEVVRDRRERRLKHFLVRDFTRHEKRQRVPRARVGAELDEPIVDDLGARLRCDVGTQVGQRVPDGVTEVSCCEETLLSPTCVRRWK